MLRKKSLPIRGISELTFSFLNTLGELCQLDFSVYRRKTWGGLILEWMHRGMGGVSEILKAIMRVLGTEGGIKNCMLLLS